MPPFAQLLPALASLRDVPRLAAALGCEPLWREATSDAWSGPTGPGVTQAAVVGRTGAFEWLAVESADPANAAQVVARRLMAQGWFGGVIGVYPHGRQIAISVAFGSAPVLEVDLDAPDRVALACLARLGASDGAAGGALAQAGRVADALAGEGIGRHFFRAFRSVLDRMATALPLRLGAADRHALALLQLTRVLFLYFVQAKGWLDSKPDFLSRQVDRCLARGRRIHRDLLRPLFFGTLNRRPGERGHTAAAFGRVPFLNGGLFEPHPLERRCQGDISNALWREAFDGLFERFHFIAGEQDPHGAIAPDMLGRVFEGVMEPEARRATGTFYTPAALVRSLVDAGLAALLAERLRCSDAAAERWLTEPHPPAIEVLRSVTILDPAVGSGAFLLGALERLGELQAGGSAVSAIRREILQTNLFGVDVNPAAVRLAELRLWLAVVAGDATEHAEQVRPLPNLDCLIRQGDSLVDPIGGIPGVRATPESGAAALAELRHQVIVATGADKRLLLRDLRRSELAVAETLLERARDDTYHQVRRCLGEARAPTLFGDRQGLTPESRARLRELRAGLKTIRELRRRVVRAGEVPWFHYESHFADVFARGGFDLVVGNPPWVRAEQIPCAHRERLAARYRWWRPGGARGFANRPDLALAFVERAYELAAPGGSIALLLPAKVATASYACAARHALAAQSTLRVVADLTGTADAEFDATVYPLALVTTKARPQPGHRVRNVLAGSDGVAVPQERLAGGGPWVLVRDELRDALTSIQSDHPRLGERFACQLGVKTGANAVFLAPAFEVEPALLRWAIRGRDVRPFAAHGRTHLLWTHGNDGKPLSELPPRAAAYVARHDRALRGRADYDGGPPWMLFRTGPATAPHRVIWADLARRLGAAALTGAAYADAVPLNSCYVAVARSAAEAHRLAGWLNCTWIRAAARIGAVPAMGGFVRLNARTVSALPLPSRVLTDSDLDALARTAARGDKVQRDLDRVTADHLGLSRSARRALRTVAGVDASHRR